ncbi:hypothetical protein FAZ15_17065 [Sphingobacterium olei]|uniref:Uncharacterized protein n=1 Tax=Sphingobacterium olei TaxID=2571155 RepID=A0A4U0NHP8_9SPHI|nr:hypothetical protein [Sphingobacterium olei]TJZ53735.1 hypothetical protein FAZ15_17065 [Sphingobacterium olei]
MIPQNFEEWKICIEKKCQIPLTVAFASQRLTIYSQRELPETQRFIKLYGEPHYLRVMEWFSRIAAGENVLEPSSSNDKK